MTTLRRGDVVRVRSREEILATLDADGTIGGLPFMPEMLQFCGTEQTIHASAHKTCDTVEHLGRSREVPSAVHLAGVRCDGSAHGGCQAQCMLFWRDEWLDTGPLKQNQGASMGTLKASTQDGEFYRCQATALRTASKPLPTTRLRQYVTDVRSRNVTPARLVKGLFVAFFNLYQWRAPRWTRLFGGQTFPFYRGTGTGKRRASGDIQVGDLVEVRSKAEIMATLSPANKNGGMLFDGEMLPFCGRQARVERKVDQIIDEPTGRMLKLNDCLVLEDVVCKGDYHRFCPRAGLPYWREAWLRKVDHPAAD